MLFGETCIILEKKNKHWFRIQTAVCGTVGWISAVQVLLVDEKQYEKCIESSALALEICHPIFNDEISNSIVISSSLPQYDGISCFMPDNKYVYVEMPMQSNYVFELLNEAGQLIEQRQTRQVDIFNTENLPSGIYYLKVISGKAGSLVSSQKIVVHH